MERVGTLIDKLKEQFVQETGADKMLLTVQMLFSELQLQATAPEARGAVSVVMPGLFAGMPQTEGQKQAKSKNNLKKAALSGWLFEMDLDIPDPLANTMEPNQSLPDAAPAIVKEMYELNDLHAEQGQVLNEQLKEERQELSYSFQDTPIVDLKKAIGVNDRYLFINELFRGDETMYERSLKTINGFNLFPEAQYWIQRELKVKLGWNDRSQIVGHFDQLVKRRFA